MIKLDLTIKQVNLILVALSKLPYETVHTLMSNIQAQAQTQLNNSTSED